MYFTDEPQNENELAMLQEVFNSLTYLLVKHYDFSLAELHRFFDLYEKETEFTVNVGFYTEQEFDDFKIFTHKQYYKDLYEQE